MVSFIRTAGVTAESAKRASSIASTSLVLALMSMMSTRPCRTISRMLSRYSGRLRKGPAAAEPPGLRPGAARPKAMSASLASARMKSRHAGSATIRLSLASRDLAGVHVVMMSLMILHRAYATRQQIYGSASAAKSAGDRGGGGAERVGVEGVFPALALGASCREAASGVFKKSAARALGMRVVGEAAACRRRSE